MISIAGISFGQEYFILIGLIAIAAFLAYNKSLLVRKENLGILATRTIAIFLLFLVLASPYKTVEEDVVIKSSSVFLINDGSASMGVYSDFDLSELKDRLAYSDKTADVKLINMSAKNQTALGDAIYSEILGSSFENNIVVLASDGNNNDGADLLDVASFAIESNTRIFPIELTPAAGEIFVRDIEGQNKVPTGSEYSIDVVIGSMNPTSGGSSYVLRLKANDETIFNGPLSQRDGQSTYSFKHVFDALGDYQITAEIVPQSQDTYPQNNIFRKSIKVIEKPRILYVSSMANGSRLQTVLNELYDIEFRTSLPFGLSILDNYNAIILDNVDSDSVNSEDLRGFLNSGGGLMVVGGEDSYNQGDYYGGSFENLLPVKSVEEDSSEGEETNVVIVLDISGSTGGKMGTESKIDVEKAIAINIIRDLSGKANVGLVVFNSQSRRLRSVAELDDPSLLEDTISRLRFVGGTYISEGLKEANQMLIGKQGSRYVILISDGRTDMGSAAYDQAEKLVKEGAVIHTVGVGFDTDEGFMNGVAKIGGGVYFAPSETERVHMLLGLFEESEEDNGLAMIITNKYHFITQDVKLANISISGFNEVSSKPGSQVLVATPAMKPLLTTWRFGLGRVISLTVDDGTKWAKNLYLTGSSKIISSSINWIIGDLEKGRETVVECMDAKMAETGLIVVSSKGVRPGISIDGEQMELSMLDKDAYYLTFEPKQEGFLKVSSKDYACQVAINYPQEYGEFSFNEELLSSIATASGGKVYKSDGLDSLVDEILSQVDLSSKGTTINYLNMQLWFTLFALIIFFFDVAIRRLGEIRAANKEPLPKKGKDISKI